MKQTTWLPFLLLILSASGRRITTGQDHEAGEAIIDMVKSTTNNGLWLFNKHVVKNWDLSETVIIPVKPHQDVGYLKIRPYYPSFFIRVEDGGFRASYSLGFYSCSQEMKDIFMVKLNETLLDIFQNNGSFDLIFPDLGREVTDYKYFELEKHFIQKSDLKHVLDVIYIIMDQKHEYLCFDKGGNNLKLLITFAIYAVIPIFFVLFLFFTHMKIWCNVNNGRRLLLQA